MEEEFTTLGGGGVCGLGGADVETATEGTGVDILLLPSSSSGIGEGTAANLGLTDVLADESPSLAVLLPLSLFGAWAVLGPTVDELVVPLSPLSTLEEGE